MAIAAIFGLAAPWMIQSKVLDVFLVFQVALSYIAINEQFREDHHKAKPVTSPTQAFLNLHRKMA